MFVTFQNQGCIDLRAVTTFGVNAKESASAIGYFGTGLKYAISVLIRSGAQVTLWVGMERYDFNLSTEEIRGKEFEFIYMNDQRLPFTTELGKNWEMWQAYRELHSNTLDENGVIIDQALAPKPDCTTIIVDCPKFIQCYYRRSEVFLEGEPWVRCEGVEIHRGASSFVYYRGIRAGELQEKSGFTFNVTAPLVLTEDRTIKSSWDMLWAIRRGILRNTNTEFLREFLTSGYEFDHKFDLNFEERPSAEFLAIAEEAYLDIGRQHNLSLMSLLKKFGKVKRTYESVELTEVEAKQLDRAVKFLKTIGYDVTRYDIVVADTLGAGILGQAISDDQKILIARRTFMMGTKMLAGTLWEEFLHLDYQFQDMTRDFQNFLVDAVMTMGEQINKEAL